MKRIHINDVEEREIQPGLKARFIHSDNMTFAYWYIKAGAALHDHSHPHEQVVNVLEGKLKLTVDGEAQILEPGSIVIVPPNAVHAGEAVTDTRLIDVFYPVREDYR